MHCILHIGTEKTGTTLIQNWLYENKDALSAQGIGLTETGEKANNRKLCAYCQDGMDDYHKRHSICDKEERQAFFYNFEKEMQCEIDSLKRSGREKNYIHL
jgi:hypothetical protein